MPYTTQLYTELYTIIPKNKLWKISQGILQSFLQTHLNSGKIKSLQFSCKHLTEGSVLVKIFLKEKNHD